MKDKTHLFLIIISICIIGTFPYFINSHSFDSYCITNNFLNQGMVMTHLYYQIVNLINIPEYSLKYISSFLSAILITIAIIKTYNILLKNLKIKDNLKKIIILLSSFLIFFNPLINSVFLLDYSFIICLGILCLTYAASYIINGRKTDYIISLILVLISSLCTIKIMPFFIVLSLLFIITKKPNKKDISLSIIYYLIGIVSSLLTIEIYSKNETTINNIFPYIKETFTNFFYYINPIIFYIIVGFLTLICIYQICKNNNKKQNSLILISVFTIPLVAFIPCLFINQIDPIPIITIGSIPALLLLFIINNKHKYILLLTSSLIFIYVIIQTVSMGYININRYKKDQIYLNDVYNIIHTYEKQKKTKIKKIYYAYDINSNNYYDQKNNLSIKITADTKKLSCALNARNNNYKIIKMTNDDYNKYFKNKNYNRFNGKQIIIKNNIVYLLIY